MKDFYTEDSDLINPLIFSYLIPVAGGVYEYINWRDSRPEVAKLFLYGTLGIPLSLGAISILSVMGMGDYYFPLAFQLGVALVVERTALRENSYSKLIWIYYAWIPGWIAAHALSPDDGHQMLMKHFVLKSIAYAIIAGLILGVISIFGAVVLSYTGIL